MCFIFGTKEGPKDQKKRKQLTSMGDETRIISFTKRIFNSFDETFWGINNFVLLKPIYTT